jgi:hypothetical protein
VLKLSEWIQLTDLSAGGLRLLSNRRPVQSGIGWPKNG